ncbi:MAG TPA: hypothetical protein VKU85_03210, partial [bacterium]|nr:hypothetical protein [bacterium]
MSRAAAFAPAIVIVLFAALFLAPVLGGDRVASTASLREWSPWREAAPPPTGAPPAVASFNPDCLTSYYPRRALFRQAWQDGEMPLWNPYSFCGMPFLADPQSQVLYPPSWLLLLLEPTRALGAFVFLHLSLAGVGGWLLLRRHRAGGRAALLGGCAFALNGFAMKHFGLPPFLATAAWLPWWILAVEDVVDRPRAAAAARLALVGALGFLAGQPQIATMMAYGAAGYGAARHLTGPHARSPAHAARALAAAVAGGVVAGLVVAAQLLPTLELAERSARARLPFETVLSGAFHPWDAIRLLVPEFFGAPWTRDEWSVRFPLGDSFYVRTQLNSIFAGTPVFLFALVGMTHPVTRRRALPFTLLFAVSLLLAFGSPLARLAHAILPGFSVGRLDRVGALVVFAQLVPAGMAASRLAIDGHRARFPWGLALAAVGALALGIVLAAGPRLPEWLGAAGPVPGSALERTGERTLVAGLFAIGAGVAWWLPRRGWLPALPFALAAVQLAGLAEPYRGDRERAEVFAATPETRALATALDTGGPGGVRFARFGRAGAGRALPLSDVMPPSTNAPHRIRDLQGYNALSDRRLGDALERATGEPLFSYGIWSARRIVSADDPHSLEHPILDALSVGVVATPGPFRADGWDAPRVVGAFRLARNREALPRVRFVPRGRAVSAAELDRALESGDLRPADEVIWPAA